jgi:acyl dehydratase
MAARTSPSAEAHVTRPADIRPKEGAQPGTPFARFRAGATLRPMRFTLDAGVVEEYTNLLGGDVAWYRSPPGEAGPLAPATAPALFLLASLYRTYPPVQGLVLTHQAFDFVAPWAPGMEITARGEITETSERRGRQFVSWTATFIEDRSGRLLTRARNTFVLPPADRQQTLPEMQGPAPAPPGGVAVTPVRLRRPAAGHDNGVRVECEQGIAMSQALFDWYGRLNGDLDVVHYDGAYAQALGYRAPIAHGLMVAGYLSELLREAWGVRWLAGGSFSCKWTAPVFPDDVILPISELDAVDGSPSPPRLRTRVRCENAAGTPVLVGEASAPA